MPFETRPCLCGSGLTFYGDSALNTLPHVARPKHCGLLRYGDSALNISRADVLGRA